MPCSIRAIEAADAAAVSRLAKDSMDDFLLLERDLQLVDLEARKF